MRPTFSEHRYGFILLILATLLMSAAAFGQAQSLGDIARENREKKAAEESSSTPPVITNKNLPKDPDDSASDDTSATPATTKTTSPFGDKTAAPSAQLPSPALTSAGRQLAEQQTAQHRANDRRAAVQWKKRILQQESTVAGLRMRVDKLRASIRFADPNRYGNSGYDYYTGLDYNRYQARHLERLAQLQQQLDQQKRKLEDMQEAARHAGMHTLVYDP
jgi:hypothetical protein